MPYSFAAGDEAGQGGFKFQHGSTLFFVVTLVLTNEPQVIRENVDNLRDTFGLSPTTELKFHSSPHSFRLNFLEKAQSWPLVARSLYVDKRLLPPDFHKMRSWEFYGFFVAQLLNRLPVGELSRTAIALDEFGPLQLTLQAIREQLRELGLWGSKTRLIRRIAFRRSHSERVIQVADMFSGTIYRWLTQNDETYYRVIKSKSLVWEYRPVKTNPPT